MFLVFSFKYSLYSRFIFHIEQKVLFICAPEMDSFGKWHLIWEGNNFGSINQSDVSPSPAYFLPLLYLVCSPEK